MAGKEDAVQEAASPASFQGNRNEYGYFLKPDDVNTFWERRYGHKCPYMDPLPVMAYLRKKGVERAKRTNEQAKTIRTLSGRALRPKTAGATLGSRLHSVAPGGQTRAKPTEKQRPLTAHHGSREVMVGQLMPPPHGTASSSILGGRRRQRTLREADVATSSPGFKAPSRPQSCLNTAEAEGLVTRRLQDALLYSEILLPTLYGHERPPSQTDTGKAKHTSRREVEDAHVEAVVSMHSRAHALRVASAAAACTEDKTLKTETPPAPKAVQTTPKPPSRASSLPASRKVMTKTSVKTPLTASSPELPPPKAAPTKSGHSGPIKHGRVSSAAKTKDTVPAKGKPEATPKQEAAPKQKEGLASSSHEGTGSATTATPGYDDEEFEVTSTHSDQGGTQAVEDEEKQALAPLGQGSQVNGSKGALGEHKPAKGAEEEHYASDHDEHEPHGQQVPATGIKAQSEAVAHRASPSDEEYTFDSGKSSPSLHASEGTKPEERQPAPDKQEYTFEMESEGSQQTKSQVSLQSSIAPPEPQEVKTAVSQAGEAEDEPYKEEDGFEADAQSIQQTKSQASLQPSLVQAQTPTQQAEPAVAEGVEKEEESYKEDDGFEVDTVASEQNKSQASLPSAVQVQAPVTQAVAVNADKEEEEEEESYKEEDGFETDAEGSQPAKSQASLQSSKAEAPAPAQQVQEAASASVDKEEEESYKEDDGFEADAEGSQQSKSQASLPTKSQTSLQSSVAARAPEGNQPAVAEEAEQDYPFEMDTEGSQQTKSQASLLTKSQPSLQPLVAAQPSQEKDEQEEEDYAFETETEDGQQTASQTSLQTKSQTSLQPSVAVQPIKPVVVEEQDEEDYAFESEAEDGQQTPSQASLPKSVAKQPSSDPPSRQSSMAADLDMDISASTAAEAEKHSAFVRGESLPPDGAGRLSKAPVIRRSVTDLEVPPTPKTGSPSPFMSSDLLKAIQEKPTLKKTAPPTETLTQKDDTEERLELTRRSQAALDELRSHLQTQQLLLAGELSLDTGEPVGRGRRAKVYQATWTKPEAGSIVSQMVAVKEFEFDSAKHALPPMPVIHAFRQELESLRRVKHENVVALLGAQLQPKLRIITELLPEGSLFDCIKRKDFWATLTLTDKLTILRDVARGLSAVHAANMAHRDVKSHNVLIDAREAAQATAGGRFHAKVADLGSAVVLQDGTQVTDEAGTSGWIAPEVLEGGGYDARADVFSLGVVVWEALSASLSNPLTSLDATRLRERLADPATHLPLPTDVSGDLRQLIAACLAVEPSQRPSMADVHKQLDAMLESDGSSQAAAEESYSDDEDYSED